MTTSDNYPLEIGGVDDYPVKVGSMLLTLVDPHKGFEAAYNRWYERDHYIAGCLIGPYNFAGSRWVATREMKDLRWGTAAIADPIDAGSYVAIYWIEQGHHEDWDAWALKQVRWLYGNGRGFSERSHVHTVTFDYVGSTYRDSDPVPVELALDHHYDAIVGVWLDGRAQDGQPVDAAALHERLAGPLKELLDDSNVEIACDWTPRPEFRNSRDSAPMSLGSPGGQENRLCQLFFVDGDVRTALPRFRTYTDRLAADGIADPLLVAPFLRTNVGTNQYVDQLW
ncbi:MAG TPA: hypothetical protein VFT62_04205 [Mycobacteriales bacterium]|nr:hypothetical protein [Mycobacteriales bacterium]